MTPDAIADAAAYKAMTAPKGSKRTAERVAKKARHLAIACNVRDAMRISMRMEGGQ